MVPQTSQQNKSRVGGYEGGKRGEEENGWGEGRGYSHQLSKIVPSAQMSQW